MPVAVAQSWPVLSQTAFGFSKRRRREQPARIRIGYEFKARDHCTIRSRRPASPKAEAHRRQAAADEGRTRVQERAGRLSVHGPAPDHRLQRSWPVGDVTRARPSRRSTDSSFRAWGSDSVSVRVPYEYGLTRRGVTGSSQGVLVQEHELERLSERLRTIRVVRRPVGLDSINHKGGATITSDPQAKRESAAHSATQPGKRRVGCVTGELKSGRRARLRPVARNMTVASLSARQTSLAIAAVPDCAPVASLERRATAGATRQQRVLADALGAYGPGPSPFSTSCR